MSTSAVSPSESNGLQGRKGDRKHKGERVMDSLEEVRAMDSAEGTRGAQHPGCGLDSSANRSHSPFFSSSVE